MYVYVYVHFFYFILMVKGFHSGWDKSIQALEPEQKHSYYIYLTDRPDGHFLELCEVFILAPLIIIFM